MRRVAVLGGNRIPFARSDRAYAEASNQDMFTAALGGLVERFGLAGERLGAVIGGAVLKHSRDFNLMRESVLGSALSSYTPAFDLQQACGTGLQAAIAAADGIAAGTRRRPPAGWTPPLMRRSHWAMTCAARCSGCAGQSPTSSG
jgi:acetyl-CoA C-acetyltransferase